MKPQRDTQINTLYQTESVKNEAFKQVLSNILSVQLYQTALNFRIIIEITSHIVKRR